MSDRQIFLIAFGCFDFGLIIGALIGFYYGRYSRP